MHGFHGRWLVLVFLLIVFSAPIWAQDPAHPKELIGAWSGRVETSAGVFIDSIELKFDADGRYRILMGLGALLKGEWSVDENTITFRGDYPEPGPAETDKWELKGDKLMISSRIGAMRMTRVKE